MKITDINVKVKQFLGNQEIEVGFTASIKISENPEEIVEELYVKCCDNISSIITKIEEAEKRGNKK